MFKKEHDLVQRSKSHMKNKDVRKLRKDVQDTFPSMSELQLGELLLEKARNDLCPTVFTLWRVPHILRAVVIHPPVSVYILKGADLMAPGIMVIEDCASLIVGERVCIRVLGNPLPLAVGRAEMDGSTFLQEEEGGRRPKGKAVSVLHAFGDLLWGQCRDALGAAGRRDEIEERLFPNEGFAKGLDQVEAVCVECESVGAIGVGLGDDEGGNSGCEEAATEDGRGDVVTEMEGRGAAEARESEYEMATEVSSLTLCVEPTVDLNPPLLEPYALASVVDEDENQGETQSAQEVEMLFIVATLRVLKYAVKDKDLPMLLSGLWSLVNKCIAMECGAGRRVDIRGTSFGKASVFLAGLQRDGLLQLREVDGQGGVNALYGVERQHELFRLHAESVQVPVAEEFRAQLFAKGERVGEKGTKDVPQGKGEEVILCDLYRFPRTIREVLVEVLDEEAAVARANEQGVGNVVVGLSGKFGECLTIAEVQRYVMSYVAARDLQDPLDKASVVIPPADGLYDHISRRVKRKDIKISDLTSTPTNDAVSTDSAAAEAVGTSMNEEEEEWGDVDRVLTQPRTDTDKYRMVAGVLVCNSSSSDRSAASTGALPLSADKPSSLRKKKPVHLPVPQVSAPPQPAMSSSQPPRQKKKGREEGTVVDPMPIRLSKQELLSIIKGCLSAYHAVLHPSGNYVVASGGPPTVLLAVEMRSGSKVVTRLHGLEAYGFNSEICAREFQKRFACSAAVAGRGKDSNIVVQGNWIRQLEEYLLSQCRIPRKYVKISKNNNMKKKR